MSGIFGVVGSCDRNELEEMGKRLLHRGPFCVWEEVTRNVYLGQLGDESCRALHSNGYALVADGFGRDQSARDDVCAAFLERGLAGLEALHSPFTLAAWDSRSEVLLLARDFLGLKPLHYCKLPSGGIAFASEYKCLLALQEVVAEPDLEALQCLQVYKAVPPMRTLLKGIVPVQPGALVAFGRDGSIRTVDCMPEVQLNVRPMSEEAASEQLRGVLERATLPLVENRSTLGIALSGGIDSLSSAFLARRCAPKAELVAFTAGSGPEDPEVYTAAKAIDRLGGRHEVIVVQPHELIQDLPLCVWHLENPIGRSETFQFLQIGRTAKKQGFDYLLTGMGADLLFAGMPRHRVLWMAEAFPPLRNDLLAFFDATQCGRTPPRWLARLMTTAYYRGGLPPVPRVGDGRYLPPPDPLASPGPEFLNRCLMLDGQEPTSRTLARIERSLQASGIDYGSPYLDRSVVDFAFTLPGALKIKRGKQKYILRQAMRPLMSDDLRNVPKDLMRMHQDAQFAETLQVLSDHYLSRERLQRRGFFNAEQVNAVRRRCVGTGYHRETAMRLWTLIVTEIWAELFLDRRGLAPAAQSTRHTLTDKTWGVTGASVPATT